MDSSDPFNVHDLLDSINNIKSVKDLSIHAYKMTDMMNEIENIQFIERQKTDCVKRFHDWCRNNPDHSFPKLKRRWISGLGSQKQICVLYLRFPVKEVLSNIRNRQRVPKYCENMYRYVHKYLGECDTTLLWRQDKSTLTTDDNIMLQKIHHDLYRRCVLIIRLTGNQCVNYLLERGVLMEKGHRLYRVGSTQSTKRKGSEIEDTVILYQKKQLLNK